MSCGRKTYEATKYFYMKAMFIEEDFRGPASEKQAFEVILAKHGYQNANVEYFHAVYYIMEGWYTA